jgi:hypothetical protein
MRRVITAFTITHRWTYSVPAKSNSQSHAILCITTTTIIIIIIIIIIIDKTSFLSHSLPWKILPVLCFPGYIV